MNVFINCLVLFGVLIHALVCFFLNSNEIEISNFGLFFYSIIFYVIIYLLNKYIPSIQFGILVALFLALGIDLSVFYGVFIDSTSSTEALSILVTPILNIFLVLPLGVSIGFIVGMIKAKKNNNT